MNTISFPGLGIGEFTINPIAFTITIGNFHHSIAWYGIILTLGILAGCMYALYRAKFEGISTDDVIDLAIFAIVFAIIGARTYYVLTDGIEKYHSFLEVIAIWNGGIAIYGAIIGGGLAAMIVALIKKMNVLRVLDMIAPGVMLGQIIGRWGNFVNAECFGEQTTLPWRMGLLQPNGSTMYVHPTFLYESLWNLVGFLWIQALYRKKRYDGQVFLWYMTWYGFGRFLVEGLRTDSLMLGNTGIRISQLLGFVFFVTGILLQLVLLILRRVTGRPCRAGSYEDVAHNQPQEDDGEELTGAGRHGYPDLHTLGNVSHSDESYPRSSTESPQTSAKNSAPNPPHTPET